uniref:AcidPPc domain-containing protein n=1 Tax=Parastrongyloides trichosuri TaxID=131310 RepID=A0A0N4ZC84_PARTI
MNQIITFFSDIKSGSCTNMLVQIKHTFIFNIITFFLLLCLFLTFQFWITPTKRGFFCNDETIRYPFKTDTISPSTLIIFSILPNILIIFYGEASDSNRNKNSRKSSSKLYIQIMFQNIGNFLWGLILLCCFINVIKVSAGRLRPFYLDVCKPDVLLLNGTCTGYEYITNFTCTGTNKALIREASLSFPSGHSAISFFAATFFILYIQNRALVLRKYYLFPSALQFTALLVASFTAVSRIFDYHHHPEDVAVGIFIGVSFAYFFFNYNSIEKNYKDSQIIELDSPDEIQEQNNSLLNNELNV